MDITYQTRWKEMLDGFYGPNRFTIEMTMGKLNVYFPTEDRWNRTAPSWAQGHEWTSSVENKSFLGISSLE